MTTNLMMTKKINHTNLYIILLAAGSSTRMGTGTKKEYMKLQNGTVLSTCALHFLQSDFPANTKIRKLIITIPSDTDFSKQPSDPWNALFADPAVKKNLGDTGVSFVRGGSSRQESVLKTLEEISKSEPDLHNSVVLVHDAARPFVSSRIIFDVTGSAIKYGAAVPVIPPVDTQKEIEGDTIVRHLTRSSMGAVQTPQGFDFCQLLECHMKASLMEKEFTDDSEIWDAFPECTCGRKVHTVKGDAENRKITFASDIKTEGEKKMIRIGMGTDLHRLTEGRQMFLGGIKIPCEKGEAAHSDGDVLLHAITDALLGASGMGDIGSYFPPDDDKWKNADSKFLLKTVWKDIKDAGWELENLDCVIETELPKFLPWRETVIESVAKVLEVEKQKIFVKAKTNEKLDSVGRKEAIKAYCVCLLSRV